MHGNTPYLWAVHVYSRIIKILASLVMTMSLFKVCVRERATKSILCVRDVSEEEAKRAVDQVFDSCFEDTFPFERVPP